MLRINDITYEITPLGGTSTPLYSLKFSIPSTGAPVRIRYRNIANPTHDSTLHDPANETVPYLYEFTGLTESDIETTWAVEWIQYARGEPYVDVIVIPNTAITAPEDTGGLTPVPSTVDITLSGEDSPYVSKKVRLSNLILELETFSVAAEYSPIKTYTLPNGARALMIEANDYVPSAFGGNREDWILYSLIIRNETYPITPRNRIGKYPTIYHLNSSLVGPVRAVRESNNEGFIDTTSGKITQVGIKIELGRPNEQASATPIVFGYKLKYIDYE